MSDDEACDFVINGDERHGYGYRCSCGDRNLGFRFVARAAAEDERDYHLGVKPRPEALGPPEPVDPAKMTYGVTCKVTLSDLWGAR